MGQEIPYKDFTERDMSAFKTALEQETEQLQSLFEADRFERRHWVGGLELEAWLVDQQAMPAAENVSFLQALNNPEVVPELSLFNIELNVQPQTLGDLGISKLYANLHSNWRACLQQAQRQNLDLMAIGTHPALLDSQLTLSNMSQSPRYKVLNERILALRERSPIKLDVRGREHLCSVHNDVMLEAATTSFQIHLQVPLERSVAIFNASQVLSAPLLALSANSPYVFGVDLWDESRVPIFEQAIDLGGNKAKRVCFGERYVKQSLMECFNKNLRTFEPLIPMLFDDDEEHFLPHLRLHNGTVWRWNRPIVACDKQGIPHLRIENRVVAAGPTLLDMMANAAFYWGMAIYLAHDMDDIAQKLPYDLMKHNFYRAVKDSLNSQLLWIDGKTHNCRDLILEQMLPGARDGLQEMGIESDDAQHWLSIIEQRVASGQNGAAWQRAWVAKHGRDMQALAQAYLVCQHGGQPVHAWGI